MGCRKSNSHLCRPPRVQTCLETQANDTSRCTEDSEAQYDALIRYCEQSALWLRPFADVLMNRNGHKFDLTCWEIDSLGESIRIDFPSSKTQATVIFDHVNRLWMSPIAIISYSKVLTKTRCLRYFDTLLFTANSFCNPF